jgi:hypothetical protein
MSIGSSIFLIAVGAILKFAVDATVSGISIQTIGVILMVAGLVGLVLSVIWMGTAARRGTVVRERPVVDDRPYV